LFLNLKESDLDRNIYRIISIQRLEELFETGENILVKTYKWEDPFENFILRSKVKLPSGEIVQYNYHNWLYGQCWSFHEASDAMWRIYSPKGDGVRIRTTVRKLHQSLFSSQKTLQEAKCAIGKVCYLNQNKMAIYANEIFDDYGITVENLFNSLLVKRTAFKHENEIRLLYCAIDEDENKSDKFSYKVEPQSLITQIMLDPRYDPEKAEELKKCIKCKTNFSGNIKRSLLYSFKNDMIINAKEIDIATGKTIQNHG
jgi:Protein of unknown function (DUF2971)